MIFKGPFQDKQFYGSMISVRFGVSLSLLDNSMHTEKSKSAVQNTDFESESQQVWAGDQHMAKGFSSILSYKSSLEYSGNLF